MNRKPSFRANFGCPELFRFRALFFDFNYFLQLLELFCNIVASFLICNYMIKNWQKKWVNLNTIRYLRVTLTFSIRPLKCKFCAMKTDSLKITYFSSSKILFSSRLLVYDITHMLIFTVILMIFKGISYRDQLYFFFWFQNSKINWLVWLPLTLIIIRTLSQKYNIFLTASIIFWIDDFYGLFGGGRCSQLHLYTDH